MTIQQLLEKLERRREAIDAAIAEIKSASATMKTRAKAKQIVESVKRGPGLRGPYKKRKKLHWTQTPRGRKIMAERAKTMWKKKDTGA